MTGTPGLARPAREEPPASTRGAPAARLCTIGEVAGKLGLPPYVLRFWEARFPQIRPLRSRAGRRLYGPEQIALLRGIRALLHEDGLSIRGALKALEERGPEAVAARGAAEAALAIVATGGGAPRARHAGTGGQSGTRHAPARDSGPGPERLRDDIAWLERTLARLTARAGPG